MKVFGVLLLLALGLVQASLEAFSPGDSALPPEPRTYVGLSIDPRIVRRFLGVQLVVADLLWIDTLIKADIARATAPFSDIYRAFRKILQLDPDNLNAYYVAGLYLSVIKDDVRGATEILRAGMQYIESSKYGRHSWIIPFTLGYNLMFEEHSFDEGGKWILRAGETPGAPPYVRALAARASTEQGRLEIGARILSDFYRHVSDPDQRTQIERKMLEIAARQEVLELNEKFEKYLTSTDAYAFPKKKQFELFMRWVGHGKNDLRGRVLGISATGKIMPIGDAQ